MGEAALCMPLSVREEASMVSAREGYDRAAEFYDEWSWQQFWRDNEFPEVLSQLIDTRPSIGVIDVGVGTGAFLSQAAEKLPTSLPLVGIDVSGAMLRKARNRLGGGGLLVQGDLSRGLPFHDAAFDAAIMMRVASHITDLQCAIAQIARILVPGGVFIATDVAPDHDYTCTRVPTFNSSVRIETRKHQLADWKNAFDEASLKLRTYKAYTYSRLRREPPPDIRRKFDLTGTRAIFHLIVASR